MFSKPEYKSLIEGCIRNVCFKHNIKIVTINVMPEHIHMVVKTSVNVNPSRVLQLVKGSSSYLFFRLHPEARYRYPRGHLWSKGKFIASIGFTDLEFTISYVLHQEEHHGSSLIASSVGNQTL